MLEIVWRDIAYLCDCVSACVSARVCARECVHRSIITSMWSNAYISTFVHLLSHGCVLHDKLNILHGNDTPSMSHTLATAVFVPPSHGWVQ